MTRRRFLSIALFASLAFPGCAARVKNVVNLPAGVTQQQAQSWDTAVANLDKIAETTSTMRQAVITLRNAGAFPDDKAYVGTLRALAVIDQVQLSASALLKQQPQAFGQPVQQQIAIYMNLIAAQVQQLNTEGVTGIKNPQSLQQINGFLATLSASVKIILALA